MAGNYTLNTESYLINGIDLNDLGAFVEYTRGLLALPARKPALLHDWPDEQGVDYDVNNVYFKERPCELSIIITGSSYEQLANRIDLINAEFMKPGLQYLKAANTSRIALVAALSGSDPEKITAHDSPVVAARVVYKLTEPYVLTRQFVADFSAAAGTVTLSFSNAAKPVVVDWGDKLSTKHKGTAVLSHTYAKAGIYCIVVTGSVDWITSIVVTGATEITVNNDPELEILEAKYYVSPTGDDSNPGTIIQPFKTPEKAFSLSSAGDLIYIRGGVYTPAVTTNNYGFRLTGKAGTAGNLIKLWAYPGETPVFDLSSLTFNTNSMFGFNINTGANYIHLKGLEIKNMPQPMRASGLGGYFNPALQVYGNNCLIELCESHHNMGPGINFSGTNNTALNCDSHHNYDPNTYSGGVPYPGGSGDGFHCASNDTTSIATYIGCRAWSNSDDGFDSINDRQQVIYRNCWAWNHGYIPDTTTHIGDGCGIKFGGTQFDEPTVLKKIVTNCITAKNYLSGFTTNIDLNTGQSFAINLFNNVSYGDKYGFVASRGTGYDFIRNNISYAWTSMVNSLHVTNMVQDHNSWNGGVMMNDGDFQSLDWTQMERPRKVNGDLPDIEFMKLASGSDLIAAGVNVGLPFTGAAPNMGAF
jgi:hypothetical protein